MSRSMESSNMTVRPRTRVALIMVAGCLAATLTGLHVPAWSPDDTRLFSCGMDGAVYEWEVATSKRLHEAVLKACGYTGLGLSADAKTVFAVGTDRKIKEIVDAQVSLG